MSQVGAFPVELGREYELKLGSSFSKTSKSAVHTFEYDFKPASAVECSDPANVNVEENGHVSVTLPTGQGNSTTYRGPKRPCPKKCILIIDRDTGEVTLERVTSTMQLKRVRTPTAKRAITTLNKIVSDKPNERGRISPLPPAPRVSTVAAAKSKQQESPLVASSSATVPVPVPVPVAVPVPVPVPTNKAPTSSQLQLSDSSSDADGSSASSTDDSSDSDTSQEEPPAIMPEKSQPADEDNPFTEQLKADLEMSESDSGDSSSDSDG